MYTIYLLISDGVLTAQAETTMPAVKAAARAIVGAVVFVPALAGGVVLEQKSVSPLFPML
jgi:hypothetical protein